MPPAANGSVERSLVATSKEQYPKPVAPPPPGWSDRLRRLRVSAHVCLSVPCFLRGAGRQRAAGADKRQQSSIER